MPRRRYITGGVPCKHERVLRHLEREYFRVRRGSVYDLGKSLQGEMLVTDRQYMYIHRAFSSLVAGVAAALLWGLSAVPSPFSSVQRRPGAAAERSPHKRSSAAA